MTGRQEHDRNMTGRQDDRQDDRQRILDEYMIDIFADFFSIFTSILPWRRGKPPTFIPQLFSHIFHPIGFLLTDKSFLGYFKHDEKFNAVKTETVIVIIFHLTILVYFKQDEKI
jgi:hypothetical protein